MNCENFCSLFPTPYSLFPVPCSLFPVPFGIALPIKFRTLIHAQKLL
ncbi:MULTISPECIES: hypothetical protein [unclassified Moorena]|nr:MULTISPECIES: hypothetical protein [unclassified Moorena]